MNLIRMLGITYKKLSNNFKDACKVDEPEVRLSSPPINFSNHSLS